MTACEGCGADDLAPRRPSIDHVAVECLLCNTVSTVHSDRLHTTRLRDYECPGCDRVGIYDVLGHRCTGCLS